MYASADGMSSKPKVVMGWMGLTCPASTSSKISSRSLSIRLSEMSFVYEKSMARNEQLRSNGSMDSAFRSTMSFLPISTNVPPSAVMRHDSSRISPVSELSTTSTPFPPVAARMADAKSVLREENMWSRGMLYCVARNSRFSSVPTVTKISACLCWASWMAERPTPPEAEWMRTVWVC